MNSHSCHYRCPFSSVRDGPSAKGFPALAHLLLAPGNELISFIMPFTDKEPEAETHGETCTRSLRYGHAGTTPQPPCMGTALTGKPSGDSTHPPCRVGRGRSRPGPLPTRTLFASQGPSPRPLTLPHLLREREEADSLAAGAPSTGCSAPNPIISQ